MPNICLRGHESFRRRNGNCIQCENERYSRDERVRLRLKEYNKNRREIIKCDPVKSETKTEYNRKYRKYNLDAIRVNQALYQKQNALYIKLVRKKVFSDELYEKLKKHNGLCDICRGKQTGRWSSLDIDHCHKNKVFRGMLCGDCNKALGLMKDDPRILRKAAKYLERFKRDHG